jgi:hypothetical protein
MQQHNRMIFTNMVTANEARIINRYKGLLKIKKKKNVIFVLYGRNIKSFYSLS